MLKTSIILLICSTIIMQAQSTNNTFPYGSVDTYEQTLELEFEGAPPAELPLLARVYNGHRWAMSTRWDDSNPNAINVRQKMLENGIHGSFYLNSRRPEKSIKTSLAYRLNEGGQCSVGGHTVSHPKLPTIPANEAFIQIMANRITLECLTGVPVNSFAFPYGQYRSKEQPLALEGISRAFLRSNYHHCVYLGFVKKNKFLPENSVSSGLQVRPGDRKIEEEKFWKHLEKIRRYADAYRNDSTCIFLGVHPWQTGQALQDLGTVMGKVRDWDDFWHCNQTEFAAFTKQQRWTKLSKTDNGNLRIARPEAFDLGDDIPLTLVFPKNLRQATLNGKICPQRTVGDQVIVNVPHGAGHKLPQIIAGDSGATIPGLAGELTSDGEKLNWKLTNSSQDTLTKLVLTTSLPPACEPGMLRNRCAELAPGESWTLELPLKTDRQGDYWSKGRQYFVAQLDGVLGAKRIRLFTTHTTTAAE